MRKYKISIWNGAIERSCANCKWYAVNGEIEPCLSCCVSGDDASGFEMVDKEDIVGLYIY